jgi:hypothetical protein
MALSGNSPPALQNAQQKLIIDLVRVIDVVRVPHPCDIFVFRKSGRQKYSHSPPKTKTPETEVSGVLLWQTRRLLRPCIVPVQPCDQAPSLLESWLFGPCRRWIFELPRISHPLALPAAKLRVAPEPAPPITPSDEVPGCPVPCIFRPCRRWDSSHLESLIHQRHRNRSSGLPQVFALPVPPSNEAPGCPESCIFRPRRRWSLELPLDSHPSAASAADIRVVPDPRSSSAAF